MTAGQQWKRLGINGGTKFQLAKSVAPDVAQRRNHPPLNSVTVSVPATLSLLTAATRSPWGRNQTRRTLLGSSAALDQVTAMRVGKLNWPRREFWKAVVQTQPVIPFLPHGVVADLADAGSASNGDCFVYSRSGTGRNGRRRRMVALAASAAPSLDSLARVAMRRRDVGRFCLRQLRRILREWQRGQIVNQAIERVRVRHCRDVMPTVLKSVGDSSAHGLNGLFPQR